MKVLKTLKYKVGYEVRTEEFEGEEVGMPPGQSLTMRYAYNVAGQAIGTPEMARFLVVKRGIKPEFIDENSNICQVGFNEEEQRWYGWSHRAITGFLIGDMLFEEDFPGATDATPFIDHGRVRIETLDQARQAAANFAHYVA